jgi:hypothetical protein
LASAGGTVALEGDQVVIKHLYIERKLAPLNLYVREAAPEEAREAVLDYGRAVKDLAASNIFPGDLLLKNFGVTRHGRVVFYDYDELCLLRPNSARAAAPPTRTSYGRAWFYVGPATFPGVRPVPRCRGAGGGVSRSRRPADAFWQAQAHHRPRSDLPILSAPRRRLEPQMNTDERMANRAVRRANTSGRPLRKAPSEFICVICSA